MVIKQKIYKALIYNTIMAQEIGREKTAYYPFFNNSGADFNKICAENIFGRFNLYNGVFLDANFAIMGSLHDYISGTQAGSLDTRIIRNASAFAQTTAQKLASNKVFVPNSVYKEIGFLEEKIEKGIAARKQEMKSMGQSDRDKLMSALQEYRVEFDNLLRKCKDKSLETKESSLYSVILEFVNYLDGTVVHALENADKEVVATALYYSLMNKESSNTSVMILSSDAHVRELVCLAYNCIVNYQSLNQPNQIKNAFKLKEQQGSTIDVIGYNNAQDKFGVLWDSVSNNLIKSILQKLSDKDADKVIRNINQRVARMNEVYCEIFHPEVKSEQISLKEGDNIIKWLRERYFEARIPVELVDSNNELMTSKLEYDMAALELCRKASDTGEGSLEEFIMKDISAITTLVQEKIRNLESNRANLAEKALKFSQQVKDGIAITSLGDDITAVYKEIGHIDSSLASLRKLNLGHYEAPKTEDKEIYSVAQMSEEWGVDSITIQNRIKSMKEKGLIAREGRKKGVYSSEEARLLRIAVLGKAISNIAKQLGCASSTVKNRLSNPQLEGKWVAIGEVTYIDESAIPIIKELMK